MPALIRRYVRPVDHNKQLRDACQPALRDIAIQRVSPSMQRDTPKKPVDFLDPMPNRRPRYNAPREMAQTQMGTRDRCTNNVLQCLRLLRMQSLAQTLP